MLNDQRVITLAPLIPWSIQLVPHQLGFSKNFGLIQRLKSWHIMGYNGIFHRLCVYIYNIWYNIYNIYIIYNIIYIYTNIFPNVSNFCFLKEVLPFVVKKAALPDRGRLLWFQVIRAFIFFKWWQKSLHIFKVRNANPKTRQSFHQIPSVQWVKLGLSVWKTSPNCKATVWQQHQGRSTAHTFLHGRYTTWVFYIYIYMYIYIYTHINTVH